MILQLTTRFGIGPAEELYPVIALINKGLSSLTFRNIAGFGRSGPKCGTPSLAVTDTCKYQ